MYTFAARNLETDFLVKFHASSGQQLDRLEKGNHTT